MPAKHALAKAGGGHPVITALSFSHDTVPTHVRWLLDRSPPAFARACFAGDDGSHEIYDTPQPGTVTVNGVSSVTNSSSVLLPSSHMNTAKRAGRSSTVPGWC